MAVNRFAKTDNQLFFILFSVSGWKAAKLVARQVSRSGDGPAYFVLALLITWLYPTTYSHTPFLQMALLAFAIERPIFFCLKHTFKRNRPFRCNTNVTPLVFPSDQFSFPSGHTAAAFVFATLLSVYFPPWAPVAYAWASLVGLSRVVLGVHYPGDILAGAALGLSVTNMIIFWG